MCNMETKQQRQLAEMGLMYGRYSWESVVCSRVTSTGGRDTTCREYYTFATHSYPSPPYSACFCSPDHSSVWHCRLPPIQHPLLPTASWSSSTQESSPSFRGRTSFSSSRALPRKLVAHCCDAAPDSTSGRQPAKLPQLSLRARHHMKLVDVRR